MVDSKTAILTSDAVYDALRLHYTPDRYALFGELRCATGFGMEDADQYLDAWMIGLWPSNGVHTTAFEIKVSRGDFIREMKKPKKRRRGLLLSNYFYFVAPKGLLQVSEIPTECGLIEVDMQKNIHKTLTAPFRDMGRPNWRFVASLCRRIHKLEEDLLAKKAALPKTRQEE